MRSATFRPIIALAMVSMSCVFAGCSGADNPKMAEVKPVVQEKPDTAAPKGAGGQPYGASKKYQDMMKK